MDWLEMVFIGSAVIGGTLLVVRMLMMVIGGLDFGDTELPTDFDGDIELDMGADFHGDIGDVEHPSADLSFKFLSVHGLTAFFTMFGLIGLAILRANLWPIVAVGGGMVAGLFTVWVMGLTFAALNKMQSDGTIKIKNAVGQQGTVYLTIPTAGSGQVSVVVQGSLKIFDAVSEKKMEIATGEKIKVTNVVDNKTLVVTKL